MDFHLLLLLSVCLLSCSGTTSGETVVTVTEGSEAVLPCFIRPEQDITQDHFEWKKDGQNVFFYERGSHYNNGLTGQDEQFKGRVSHFQDQLQFSNASIVIRDTKPSDSGTYTCDISPDEPNRQRFNIKLDVVAVVTVREGSEAVLPCFIRPERDITRDDFDWRKVVQMKDDKLNVFHYKKGQHYNDGLTGQDEQFKGRVSHSQDQLQSGNASIKIRDTKLSDRGNYTCEFSPGKSDSQIFYIELVVDCGPLRDRSEENIPGACSEPHATQLMGTKDWALLQCYIRDASPKPEVKWQDSDGNILPAEEPEVTENDGRFNITLQTNVTKTGNYYCVAKQLEICHQIHAKTYVYIHGPEPPKAACRQPSVTILEGTNHWAILQCEVQLASPKPTVQWRDSAGNILTAEETPGPKTGGNNDIVLKIKVTETDKYRCVVIQEKICHQIFKEIFVNIPGPEPTKGPVTGWSDGAFSAAVVFGVLALLLLLYIIRHRIQRLICGQKKETKGDEEKNPTESVELNKKPDTSEPQ